MALSAITQLLFQRMISWTVKKTQTGLAKGISSSEQLTDTETFTLGTAADQAQNVATAIIDVTASGTTNVDLTALTSVVGDANMTVARVKLFCLELLAVADGGTACSSVTVGNAASNAWAWILSVATTTYPLKNGDWVAWKSSDATGVVVDSTHKVIKVLNNDAVNAAKLRLTVFTCDS